MNKMYKLLLILLNCIKCTEQKNVLVTNQDFNVSNHGFLNNVKLIYNLNSELNKLKNDDTIGHFFHSIGTLRKDLETIIKFDNSYREKLKEIIKISETNTFKVIEFVIKMMNFNILMATLILIAYITTFFETQQTTNLIKIYNENSNEYINFLLGNYEGMSAEQVLRYKELKENNVTINYNGETISSACLNTSTCLKNNTQFVASVCFEKPVLTEENELTLSKSMAESTIAKTASTSNPRTLSNSITRIKNATKTNTMPIKEISINEKNAIASICLTDPCGGLNYIINDLYNTKGILCTDLSSKNYGKFCGGECLEINATLDALNIHTTDNFTDYYNNNYMEAAVNTVGIPNNNCTHNYDNSGCEFLGAINKTSTPIAFIPEHCFIRYVNGIFVFNIDNSATADQNNYPTFETRYVVTKSYIQYDENTNTTEVIETTFPLHFLYINYAESLSYSNKFATIKTNSFASGNKLVKFANSSNFVSDDAAFDELIYKMCSRRVATFFCLPMNLNLTKSNMLITETTTANSFDPNLPTFDPNSPSFDPNSPGGEINLGNINNK